MPDSGNLLYCSFCGKSQQQVKKLIAGPHAFICDGCVNRAQAVISGRDQTVGTAIATIQQVSDEAGEQRCSFCGKHRRQVAAMASAGDTLIICDECLALCDEILSDEPPIPRR